MAAIVIVLLSQLLIFGSKTFAKSLLFQKRDANGAAKPSRTHATREASRADETPSSPFEAPADSSPITKAMLAPLTVVSMDFWANAHLTSPAGGADLDRVDPNIYRSSASSHDQYR